MKAEQNNVENLIIWPSAKVEQKNVENGAVLCLLQFSILDSARLKKPNKKYLKLGSKINF